MNILEVADSTTNGKVPDSPCARVWPARLGEGGMEGSREGPNDQLGHIYVLLSSLCQPRQFTISTARLFYIYLRTVVLHSLVCQRLYSLLCQHLGHHEHRELEGGGVVHCLRHKQQQVHHTLHVDWLHLGT